MAIGAHIGDMELTTGGVLASEAKRGNKIVLVALTAGEKGNPAGMDVATYRVQKEKEAKEGAELLGGTSIVFDIPDGLLKADDETILKVCDVIRQEKPDVLITHWKNSVHKDHATCHRIVTHARYYAANCNFERAREAHSCSKLLFSENLEDREMYQPFLYVDISEGYTLWKELVMKHWFVTHSTDHRYWDYYDALSVCRGAESQYYRAETFMVREGFDHVEVNRITEW